MAPELPLFPLQAVLFPDGLLGLKIFEARYLDLITTCLRERSAFGVVALRTLKRRRHHVREVPIPPELGMALERHFVLASAQRDPVTASKRLWPMRRETVTE